MQGRNLRTTASRRSRIWKLTRLFLFLSAAVRVRGFATLSLTIQYPHGCVAQCLDVDPFPDIGVKLGCARPYNNDCYCATDAHAASVVSSYLPQCASSICSSGDLLDDLTAMESIYASYCLNAGYTAPGMTAWYNVGVTTARTGPQPTTGAGSAAPSTTTQLTYVTETNRPNGAGTTASPLGKSLLLSVLLLGSWLPAVVAVLLQVRAIPNVFTHHFCCCVPFAVHRRRVYLFPLPFLSPPPPGAVTVSSTVYIDSAGSTFPAASGPAGPNNIALGVGIGVGIVVLAVVGLIVCLCRRKRTSVHPSAPCQAAPTRWSTPRSRSRDRRMSWFEGRLGDTCQPSWAAKGPLSNSRRRTRRPARRWRTSQTLSDSRGGVLGWRKRWGKKDNLEFCALT